MSKSESIASTLSTDLKKVAALVNAGFPTRVYYVGMGGFDTHAGQAGSQQQLLMYVADALEGFMKDMKRIGRSSDVAMMMFTEFGRRVEENQSGGTDHGTATPMYIIGEKVKAGNALVQVYLWELPQGTGTIELVWVPPGAFEMGSDAPAPANGTNYFVDFANEVVQLTATNNLNLLQSTNRTSPGWYGESLWYIQGGPADQLLSINPSWIPIGALAANMPYLLASNKLTLVAFAIRGDNETNVTYAIVRQQ